jgi:Zn ribbon nucleic-acid-binding protein
MGDPSGGPQNAQRPTVRARECPLCGDHYPQDQRQRHRIRLEDEVPDSQSRIVARSVCPTCWEALYTPLADNSTQG